MIGQHIIIRTRSERSQNKRLTDPCPRLGIWDALKLGLCRAASGLQGRGGRRTPGGSLALAPPGRVSGRAGAGRGVRDRGPQVGTADRGGDGFMARREMEGTPRVRDTGLRGGRAGVEGSSVSCGACRWPGPRPQAQVAVPRPLDVRPESSRRPRWLEAASVHPPPSPPRPARCGSWT